MKFNEKLIELRKKEGLSQEELGYKLNVTRQTISKWELGQTTPEMEKLVEIGKLFNISVDDLINDSEVQTQTEPAQEPIIEDKPIGDKGVKNNKIGIILVVLIIVLLIGGIFSIFKPSENTNTQESAEQNIIERFFGLFDKILDKQDEMFEQNSNIIGDAENIISNSKNEIEKARFNGTLELYKGSNSGTQLKRLLDEVITSNQTEDRKVTIKYSGIGTQDVEEIKTLKTNIKDSNNFEVFFEYDEEGFINKATIEKVVTQFEINKFNNSFELFAGTKMGGTIITVVDSIITSNKTEERKITVKYNQIETQDENEIKNIKRNIGTFNNYELTFEYDEDGFINKAIIENF